MVQAIPRHSCHVLASPVLLRGQSAPSAVSNRHGLSLLPLSLLAGLRPRYHLGILPRSAPPVGTHSLLTCSPTSLQRRAPASPTRRGARWRGGGGMGGQGWGRLCGCGQKIWALAHNFLSLIIFRYLQFLACFVQITRHPFRGAAGLLFFKRG